MENTKIKEINEIEKLLNESTGYKSQFAGYSNNKEVREKMKNKSKKQRKFFDSLMVK